MHLRHERFRDAARYFSAIEKECIQPTCDYLDGVYFDHGDFVLTRATTVLAMKIESVYGMIENDVCKLLRDDPEWAADAIKEAGVVIHLAACTGVQPSVDNPHFDCETNVSDHTCVIEMRKLLLKFVRPVSNPA